MPNCEKQWQIRRRRGLQVPALRQDWDAEQKPFQTEPWEQFFDLIYVGVVSQLAAHFNGSLLGHANVMVSVIYMFILVISWIDFTTYFDRFKIKGDIYTDLLLFLYSTAIVVSAVCVPTTFASGLYFAYCMAASQAAMILLHLPIALKRENPRLAKYALMKMTMSLVLAAIWFGSVQYAIDDVARVVWTLSTTLFFLFVCVIPDWSPEISFTLPKNIHHLSERFATLVMVFLGESVQRLIFHMTVTDVRQVTIVFLGFLICFSIQQMCSEASTSSQENGINEIQTSKLRCSAYIIVHMILFIPLIGVGLGLKRALQESALPECTRLTQTIMSFSYLATALITKIIRMLHPYERRNPIIWTIRATTIITSAIILPAIDPVKPISLLCIVAGIGLWLFLVDRGRNLFSKEIPNDDVIEPNLTTPGPAAAGA